MTGKQALAMSADPTLHGLDKDLSNHVAECAVRYEGIRADIKNLKRTILIAFGIMTSATSGLILALGLVAWAFIKREFHLP